MALGLVVALPAALFAAELRPGTADERFFATAKAYLRDYEALAVPAFARGYQENFKAAQRDEQLRAQARLFERSGAQLRAIGRARLGKEARYLYDQLAFELQTNQRRVALERAFAEQHAGQVVPADGLFHLPDHAAWYALYLERSASRTITPAEVRQLGEREIERITAEIKKLQRDMGYAGDDEAFRRHLDRDDAFLRQEAEVRAAFEALKRRVEQALASLFADTAVPPLSIRPLPDATPNAPPAIYDGKGTFLFGFAGGRTSRRTLDWSFLHEAIPGHHLQINAKVDPGPLPELRSGSAYAGFTEGWGAYCEDLGKSLGLYGDPESYLGKWEWDLARSVRLVIDVGIHAEGWSKEEALAYWKAHAFTQPEIAGREVERITRWPGQAVSYKVGEAAILELRRWSEQKLGPRFDVRRFHSLVLSHGSVPLKVLETIVRDGI
jgi:uncharacterized protein (DUF885 family)